MIGSLRKVLIVIAALFAGGGQACACVHASIAEGAPTVLTATTHPAAHAGHGAEMHHGAAHSPEDAHERGGAAPEGSCDHCDQTLLAQSATDRAAASARPFERVFTAAIFFMPAVVAPFSARPPPPKPARLAPPPQSPVSQKVRLLN